MDGQVRSVGFAAELPPLTASIIADLDEHQWQDSALVGTPRCDQRSTGTDERVRSSFGQLAERALDAFTVGSVTATSRIASLIIAIA
jgi:hypothetical protein